VKVAGTCTVNWVLVGKIVYIINVIARTKLNKVYIINVIARTKLNKVYIINIIARTKLKSLYY